jgi:hypothetical protein
VCTGYRPGRPEPAKSDKDAGAVPTPRPDPRLGHRLPDEDGGAHDAVGGEVGERLPRPR